MLDMQADTAVSASSAFFSTFIIFRDIASIFTIISSLNFESSLVMKPCTLDSMFVLEVSRVDVRCCCCRLAEAVIMSWICLIISAFGEVAMLFVEWFVGVGVWCGRAVVVGVAVLSITQKSSSSPNRSPSKSSSCNVMSSSGQPGIVAGCELRWV